MAGIGFVEKPDEQKARSYVASGDYLWNSGIFVWRIGRILALIERHLPHLAAALGRIEQAYPGGARNARVEKEYARLERISIDCGVAEKLTEFRVIPAGFGWDDVGDWASLDRILPADEAGNVTIGSSILIGAKNCVVHAGYKPIAVLGAEDLIIVDSPQAILVCPKRKAQDVKEVMARFAELYGDSHEGG